MSLDLSRTISQVQALAARMRGTRDDRAARLHAAVMALQAAEANPLRHKADQAQNKTFFLPADPLGKPGERYARPSVPADYCALSVDGSHIDVDRHLPARCFLINVGGCMLTYGKRSEATMMSAPTLYASEEQLSIRNPQDSTQEEPIQGALLGIKRTVEEFTGLADFAKQAPNEPTVAFVDGSLILWELGGGSPGNRYPDYVRKALLEDGLLPALGAFRALNTPARPLALAAYVSLPNGSEVAGTTRLALCPYPVADCRTHCKATAPGKRGCDAAHGFVDRDLFGQMLGPGERSALFRTRLAMLRDYGDHQVCFFYLNVGTEIARIEVPQWVADDRALLDLVHAVALDQARRGNGYPPVIQESHEQAVITSLDRAEFRRMVEESLEGEHLPADTSEKQRSKRFRWV